MCLLLLYPFPQLHCPNLEELDLSNCLFGNCLLKLPLEHLQEACPSLKHLLLGRSLFQVKEPTNKELVSIDCAPCICSE